LQVRLRVIQARKEDAEGVALPVAVLLRHESAPVRGAALAALTALGPAARKALPNLSQLLLDRSTAETDPAVRQALARLLEARFNALTAEEMTELLPWLRHKDPRIVLVGLKVVQARKEEAAGMAMEVAPLLQHEDEEVRDAALRALKTLGPVARKALPKLFEVLGKTPRYQRTSLALLVAGIVDARDAAGVQPLVPILLDGLHPEALRTQGEETEAQINAVLVKIGQPAVEGIFTVLGEILKLESPGKDNINYRKTLYYALAGLGPSCKSIENFKRVKMLRDKEPKNSKGKPFYEDVVEAAQTAYGAMDPR
jgi:hypothetical protein